MQTKEEVLVSVYDERGDCFMLGDGIDFFDGKLSSVYKAMDIWSKKVAIEFTHWVSSHQWQYLFWGGNKGEGWYKGNEFNCPSKTDEELYELFLNKDNPNDIPESVG